MAPGEVAEWVPEMHRTPEMQKHKVQAYRGFESLPLRHIYR